MNERLLRTSLLAVVLLMLLPAALSAQWRRLNVFPGTFFNEVFFVDNNHGWLTQHLGIVVRTTDGGNTWQSANLPGSTGSFNRDICFLNTQTGYVSGDDGIWRTADGGVTWTNVTPPGVAVTGNSSNWFIDPTHGVYGFGPCNGDTVRFFSTSDGGATWTQVFYAQQTDVAVGGICYTNGAYYAAGGVGKLWKSTDNGLNWTLSSTGSGGFHEDAISIGGTVHLASVDGSVCGVSGSGKTVRSSDGGNTWQMVAFPNVLIWGITMYSPTEGWSCGDGGHAYYTSDGGATWTEKSCGMSRIDRVDDIHFTDATHGWACGDAIYKYVGDGYSVAPDTIDFGDVIVGQSSADSIAHVLALGSTQTVNRTLSGVNVNDFQPSRGLAPLSIVSCQDGQTYVRFRPLSEGVKYAQVNFAISGFPADNPVVYLKGRGVKPKISSDTLLPVDTVVCGATGYDTITIRNVGTAPLQITGVTTLAPASTTYQLISPALPDTIRAGDSARFVVKTGTTSYGLITGTLAFLNNDTDPGKSPWQITLRMYRRQIAAALDRDTLVVIPSAPFGVKSTGCVNYRNMGDGLQTIESLTPTPTDAVIGLEPGASGAKVPRGGTQAICFSASASDTAVHRRRFRVHTQPCGLDTFITVVYQASNPVITSNSAYTIVSGSCDTSATDTVMITNAGNAPLVIDQPIIGGADRTSFGIVSPATWPDTLLPGEKLAVVVQGMLDATSGSRRGTITFPNNDGLPGKNRWVVDLTALRGSSELTLSRNHIDVGDICVNDAARTERVTLRNIGTAPALIREVVASDTTLHQVFLAKPAPATLGANVSDSIAFVVAPSTIGPFTVTYLLRHDPCNHIDTIVITGRAVGVLLAATPSPIDFGSAQIAHAAQKTVTVRNDGNIDATITSWTFSPPVAGARVVSPPLPLHIPAGGSSPVTVELTPADTGSTSLVLMGASDAPCPDTLATPITVHGVKGAILTDRLHVDLGSILSCGSGTAGDSVSVTNSGNAPITLQKLSFASGTGFAVDPPINTPLDIPPGSTLVIHLSLLPAATGALSDELILDLDQAEQPQIHIPLSATRDRAELAVNDDAGQAATSMTFGTLTHCDTLHDRMLQLVNNGTVADTIALAITGQPFSFGGPANLILQPGESRGIPLHAGLSLPGTATGALDVVWQPCGLKQTVVLDAGYAVVSGSIADVAFQNVALNAVSTQPAQVANTGTLDQVVENVVIDPLSNDPALFSIVGNYSGATVPAGGVLPVTVQYNATTPGSASARVLAIMRSPCNDTLAGNVTGQALRDEIDTIVLHVGQARGRWGTIVEVPVGIRNDGGSGVRSFDVAIVASPLLLDPSGDPQFAHPEQMAGWTVTRTGYNTGDGTLRLRLAATTDAPLLPSSDTLIVLRYSVLRGSEIAADLEPAMSNLPSNIVAVNEPGNFALEDYCDAYGRLLRVQGNVALDQNIPNPYNPETIIEFETAFQGHVLLAVYDGVGREVMRLVDEELPAGRRRVRCNASGLASGVYTYKLVTGLQVLTRRMIVTK
ncbi:MAG TPA: choice-of-anchor D domain-containing protein [Candidatus Kapabacteria bacterium]|nr:choice-of-anchor D domain-containing protein [Candidatus Kapabacteria bacterium]